MKSYLYAVCVLVCALAAGCGNGSSSASAPQPTYSAQHLASAIGFVDTGAGQGIVTREGILTGGALVPFPDVQQASLIPVSASGRYILFGAYLDNPADGGTGEPAIYRWAAGDTPVILGKGIPLAINSLGMVAGTTASQGPFAIQDARTSLGLPALDQPTAINAEGDIALSAPSGGAVGPSSLALIVSHGVPVTLPQGNWSVRITALEGSVAVGAAYTGSTARAFLWRRGDASLTFLPPLPGDDAAIATALEGMKVYGSSFRRGGAGPSHAVVWEGGQAPRDLGAVSGVSVGQVLAVSHGRILASQSGDDGAFLLTPLTPLAPL